MFGPEPRLKVHLVQDANINALLAEELSQFQYSAASTISFPTGKPQVFSFVS
jgi:hypothetical protein